MEIAHRVTDHATELLISGRLDSYWASHLSTELEALVRAGTDRITLDFTDVGFLSSAGISVLLRYYRKLRESNGNLRVVHPNDLVRSVMDHSGITSFLVHGEEVTTRKKQQQAEAAFTVRDTARAVFSIAVPHPGAHLRCSIHGHPDRLFQRDTSFGERHRVTFPADTMGLGIGAFGVDEQDSRSRFGEFLAAGGGAVYLPSDGTNVPDYMLSTGSFVPEMDLLYGISCSGPCSHFARFEAKIDARGVAISEICMELLEILSCESTAFVMMAETNGLVGTSLRSLPEPPVPEGTFFSHPAIRSHLSFTAEPAHAEQSVLAVGIVSKAPRPLLAPFLRPMHASVPVQAHVHAMAASYKHLKKEVLDIRSTVASFIEEESIRGIMHLLNDDRITVGQGESEFVRGAIWCGEIIAYD